MSLENLPAMDLPGMDSKQDKFKGNDILLRFFRDKKDADSVISYFIKNAPQKSYTKSDKQFLTDIEKTNKLSVWVNNDNAKILSKVARFFKSQHKNYFNPLNDIDFVVGAFNYIYAKSCAMIFNKNQIIKLITDLTNKNFVYTESEAERNNEPVAGDLGMSNYQRIVDIYNKFHPKDQLNFGSYLVFRDGPIDDSCTVEMAYVFDKYGHKHLTTLTDAINNLLWHMSEKQASQVVKNINSKTTNKVMYVHKQVINDSFANFADCL